MSFRLKRSLLVIMFSLLASVSLFAKKKPAWLLNPPGGSTYYLGVGASDTGNKGDDYQIALERAKGNLAADISVRIMSESKDSFRSTKTTTDKYGESIIEDNMVEQYEQDMSQFVENNLKEIEIVDQWSNRKEGTWVFVRLSKAAYERMKQKDMAELRGRVLKQIDPIFAGKVSLPDAISRYFKAWNQVNDSFYSDEVKGTVNGQQGFLIDRIEEVTADLLSSVHFSLSLQSQAIEINKPLPVIFSLSADSMTMGRVPLKLVQGSDDNVLASFSTDSKGQYNQPIQLDGLQGIGKMTLRCLLDLSDYQNELNRFSRDFRSPGEDFNLIINRVKLGFQVETGTAAVPGIENSIKSLIRSMELPVELQPGVTGNRDLKVEVAFSLMPKMFPNQPQMVKVRALFVLQEGGNTVFSFESDEIKSGGATEDQAYYNAWMKLQKILNADKAISLGISSAL